MKTFREYIAERYINLLPHHEEEKRKHAKEAYSLVQNLYKSIGGIHGNGFKSHEDMVKNIPFWKIHKKDGKIRAIYLYKDKGSRKAGACGYRRIKRR